MYFKSKVLKFILIHTFLVLVTVELEDGVYRKLYTLIGGQRAEKFQNNWVRAMVRVKVRFRVYLLRLVRFYQAYCTLVVHNHFVTLTGGA